VTAQPEAYLPHVGWVRHPDGDEVAAYLNQGWYEYREQAFAWLYLRPGDVVIDCGAYFGLYSLIAARALENTGTILAIEPNPRVTPLLRENLDAGGATCARIVEAAISSAVHKAELHIGASSRAAYAGLSAAVDHTETISVQTLSIDALLEREGMALVNFLKIDVEGAELDVIEGARASITSGALPLLMVEFSEHNLLRVGHTSRELYDALTSSGYTVCRFDTTRRALIPCTVTEPLWYENLFAATDVSAVNDRLRTAPAARRRIAEEVIRRGRDADRLHCAKEAAQAHQNAIRHTLDDATRDLRVREQHLRSLLTSKYMRALWRMGLVRKPDWVDGFLRQTQEHERPQTDSQRRGPSTGETA
jgi:FkbM family methyltransferase